jgi:cytochrome b subunit of formate dehydrogenase
LARFLYRVGWAILLALAAGPVGRADPAADVARSAHSSLKCADCHDDFEAAGGRPVKRVDCLSCHDDSGAKHVFHRRLALSPLPPGPDTACADCHGSHAIVAADSAQFPFANKWQTTACGECHAAARDKFFASAHARAFTAGPGAPSCLTCHRQALIAADSGKPDVAVKLRQAALCESCHVNQPSVANQNLRGNRFVAAFDRSVHGAALHRGNGAAATCVDCHGAHEMNQAMAVSARMGKQHAAESCGRCHAKEAAQYADSVHASALRRGAQESPSCPDCHGEHDIRAHTDPTSPVYARNLAQQVCAKCHDSLPLANKYGLVGNAFQTFSDSYHGLAEREGAVAVANCASCHGAHGIKVSTDPSSSINRANLARTCGQCHQGANARFGVGAVHVNPEAAKGRDGASPALHLVASLYVVLIVGVVGGMLLHNLLDFLKKVRRKLWIQKGLIEEEPVAHRLHLRMTGHERAQHGLLVLSFIVLVLTGFMLHYPDAWWVWGVRRISARAFELRGLVHRIAGVAMLAGGAWHVAYLAFSPAGRGLLAALLPCRRDLTDPWRVAKYNLGLAADKPRFGRFCYVEKAEYWAVIWGSLVMGATGAVLWFDNWSMGLLTKLGFDIARTIHFYEAVLATLAIIVWHFYWVIFNPDVYPMSLAWLTGRMSEREMLEEHPLELDQLKKTEAAKPTEPPAVETDP